MLRIPAFCAVKAEELKASGRVEWMIGDDSVLELWLAPDKDQGKMMVMSRIDINTATLTITMQLDIAGLCSMDATVEDLTMQAFMIYQTYFYAMPKATAEMAAVMCALQDHTMPEDPEVECTDPA